MYKEHRQLRQVIKLLTVLLIVINFIACTNLYEGDFEVIKYHKSIGKWPCFIKKEKNQYWVIEYKRRYRDGKLIEYEGCASEGLYTLDFQKYADYLNEDKLVKKLSIGRTTKEVKFFNETYPIIKQTKDSVFVKTKIKDEFYVFIGKIPFIK
jgi:hypothetical protein